MVVDLLLIGFGVVVIAGGLLGKTFYKADIITLSHGKEKSPTWFGRLAFLAVGIGLLAIGLKLLLESH